MDQDIADRRSASDVREPGASKARQTDGEPGAKAQVSTAHISWTSILIVALLVFPLLPLVIWSLASRWNYPAILPTEWSWRAWEYTFSPTSQVPGAFGETVLIAVSAAGLSLAVGVPAGRALGLYRYRGKRLVEFIFLAPIVVPSLAVAMGLHVLFIRYGLTGSTLGVVVIHLVPTLPYVILIMTGVFANYNADFELQARSLGAGSMRIFRHVTLPAILPGMIVAALFAFITSWSQYVITLLIGGGKVTTLPLLLYSFAVSGDQAVAGAMAVVFVIPAIIVIALSSRFLTGRSVAAGGL